jgi:hypothetical protein
MTYLGAIELFLDHNFLSNQGAGTIRKGWNFRRETRTGAGELIDLSRLLKGSAEMSCYFPGSSI